MSQIDETFREGLVKVGASQGELDHVFEVGIPTEEKQRRFEECLDAQIAKGLAGAGFEKRTADDIKDHRVRRGRRRPRFGRAFVLLGAGVLAVGAYYGYRALDKSACDRFADPARFGGILAQPLKVFAPSRGRGSCAVMLQDARPDRYDIIVRIEMGDGSQYGYWHAEVARHSTYTLEPLSLGDEAELAVAAEQPRIDVDAELKKAHDNARRIADIMHGDGDTKLVVSGKGKNARPVSFSREDSAALIEGDEVKKLREKLLNAPPSSHQILVRAGRNAMRIEVHGTVEQARAVAKALEAPGSVDIVRKAHFR